MIFSPRDIICRDMRDFIVQMLWLDVSWYVVFYGDISGSLATVLARISFVKKYSFMENNEFSRYLIM